MKRDRRRQRPKNDKITVMLIPGNAQETRTLAVSKRWIKYLGIVTLGFLICFAWLSCSMYSAREDVKNVRAIKHDNQQKAEQLEKMSEVLSALELERQEIEEKQEEIKRLMGVRPETPSRGASSSRDGGRGGGDPPSLKAGELTGELERAHKSLKQYSCDLNNLKEHVERNQAYFLALPSNWPLAGRITSEFGWRKSPFGKKKEFHHGVDLAADVGTPVMAAGRGKVVYAGRDRVYGRLIKINHGNGYITWYGHNYRLLVKEGDQVEKGQVIARSGNSGRSTGPHLHFAVEKNGSYCNPLLYLPEPRS